MKKLMYFLMLIVFIASSCNDEEQFQKYDLGTEFLISDGGYTSLDDEVTISITNDIKNLSQISVTHLGGLTTDKDVNGELITFDPPKADLGTITLSDGSGTMVISDTDLGMTQIGWSADLQFNSTFGDKNIVRYHSLEVSDPISIEAPTVQHKDTLYHLVFKIEPASATVTNVKVEAKLSTETNYNDITPANVNLEKDSVPTNGLDWAVGDTIMVKVTASTANKTASTVTKLVVEPCSFENVDKFVLDTTANLAFNLDSAEYVDASTAGDTADIEFTAAYPVGTGPVMVGFVSNNNADFVAATADDYNDADTASIKATDFAAAVKTVADAQEGDVYIYRTRRGTGAWSYGILKIIKVDKPQGVLEDSSITIEYKH